MHIQTCCRRSPQGLVTLGQLLFYAMACSSGSANVEQEPKVVASGGTAGFAPAPVGGANYTGGGTPSGSLGGNASTSGGATNASAQGGSAVPPTSKGGSTGKGSTDATGGATTSSQTNPASSGNAGRSSSASTAQVAGNGPAGGSAIGGSSTTHAGSNSTGPSGGRSAATGGTPSGGTMGKAGSTVGGATSTVGGTAGANSSSGATGVAGAAFSSILEPATGALLGLYYGDASITATATKLGRTVPLHLTYYAWSDDWTTGVTTSDLNAGRIPFVCWELFGATLSDIAAGNYDTMLKQRAASAKQLNKQMFVDFGAEMNGDWSPWSGAENGQSSAPYVAAYRHVHDIFVAAGATNLIWAFCPNVTSVPAASWNEPLDYYPGDNYVDWMCVDGYNWGNSSSGDGWQSFYEVFRDIYPVLASKNKPIIIGEMASTELGGNKATWIAEMIPTMKSQFPRLKGLNWFDVNKETDWRISSSSASEAAFKQMANDPWFVRY